MQRLSITRRSSVPSVYALFMLMGLLTNVSLFAQGNPVKELTYYATEDVKTQSPPSFPGGHDKLEEFVRTQVENTPDGIKLRRKVYITAKINESGKVIELKSAYNADPSLERELKRIVPLMPAWQAGKVNGKGVLSDYTFLLERNE